MTLSGKAKSPRLKLSMVDFDVVRRFGRVVAGGHFSTWRFEGYQDQLCWYTGKKSEVARIIDLMMPYFGVRRLERAVLVLSRATDAPFEGWDASRETERVTEIYG